MKKLVTIFGPSECRPGQQLYEEAVQLGAALTEHNFIVVSGSYEGVMEGVAKGASEAGGAAIGVTAEVYTARGREPNKYLSKEVRVKSAVDQLMELIDLGDAYIALGSDPGTLLEVMTAWDFMSKKFLTTRPLILVGEGWHEFAQLFSTLRYFESSSEFVSFVDDVPRAIDILEARLGKQLDLPTLNVIQSR